MRVAGVVVVVGVVGPPAVLQWSPLTLILKVLCLCCFFLFFLFLFLLLLVLVALAVAIGHSVCGFVAGVLLDPFHGFHRQMTWMVAIPPTLRCSIPVSASPLQPRCTGELGGCTELAMNRACGSCQPGFSSAAGGHCASCEGMVWPWVLGLCLGRGVSCVAVLINV